MKKSTSIILTAIGGMLLIVTIMAAVFFLERRIKQVVPEETGTAELFFCPREDCEQALMSAINTATETIQCAFYDLTLNKTLVLLEKKKQQGINVEIIVDKDSYKKVKKQQFIEPAKNKALMHNKFCVIDNRVIITGSMNPTTNDATKNNNNLLVITSRILAKNYAEEFYEMKKGVYGKGKKTPHQKIMFNNKTMENYFCPEDQCEEKVIRALEQAKQEIYFMTFSFTSEAIAEILKKKKKEGINVKGITEERRISRKEERWKTLTDAGIDVLPDTNPHILHHKVFIIDNATVIFGSYNPTAAANTKNDENIIISSDNTIARLFVEEFDGLQ